jgi:kelch-like protein 2/3
VFAIYEVLLFISKTYSGKYLIATDSMSCLQALVSNPFNSNISPLVLLIKSCINYLNHSNRCIQLLWIPSHIGILGNEVADRLAKSTAITILPSPDQLPWTDFTPLLRCHVLSLWSNQWNKLLTDFASKYKNTAPKISNNKTWFNNLNLPRSTIVCFNSLRVRHSLLPDHAYKLGLNDSPLCSLHTAESICDFQHLLFHCPSLCSERLILLNLLRTFNIPLNLFSILKTNSEIVINEIIKFILDAGFAI